MDETSGELEALQSKLDESERERSELQRRAEVAEALVESQERNLDDMRTAMRMLEAGQKEPATNVASSDETNVPTPTTKLESSFTGQTPKVKWRHRIFGQ